MLLPHSNSIIYLPALILLNTSPSATISPVVTFLLVLVIGIVAGILLDRLAGPSWLARQFSGSTRGNITNALVGVASAFIGYHIAVLLALGGALVTSVIAAGGRCRCGAIRLADG